MARHKIGKMDTTTLLLIGGVAVVAIYFMTKPKVITQPGPYASSFINTQGGGYLLPGNQTAQDISAGGGAASQVINSLSNAGIFG